MTSCQNLCTQTPGHSHISPLSLPSPVHPHALPRSWTPLLGAGEAGGGHGAPPMCPGTWSALALLNPQERMLSPAAAPKREGSAAL